MRRRLGRLAGRKLAVTAVKIALASAALAVVAWIANESAGALPLHGLALEFSRVIASDRPGRRDLLRCLPTAASG